MEDNFVVFEHYSRRVHLTDPQVTPMCTQLVQN